LRLAIVRFALEAFAAARVAGQVGSQKLDRDDASEAGITRAVNLAHPARAEEVENCVWP
jgi:hypothetical protein